MSERKLGSNKQGSGIRVILFGCLIGFVSLLILFAVSSLIIANSNMSLENIKYFCLLSLLISSLLAAICSAFKNRSMKGFLTGILTTAILNIVFLIVIIAVNNGAVSSFSLIAIIAAVLAGLPGGIIGANLKQ